MTPRQQEVLLKFWPLIVAVGSLLVYSVRIESKVTDAVPKQRFVVDSIANSHDHRDFERRVNAMEQALGGQLESICRAVRCK